MIKTFFLCLSSMKAVLCYLLVSFQFSDLIRCVKSWLFSIYHFPIRCAMLRGNKVSIWNRKNSNTSHIYFSLYLALNFIESWIRSCCPGLASLGQKGSLRKRMSISRCTERRRRSSCVVSYRIHEQPHQAEQRVINNIFFDTVLKMCHDLNRNIISWKIHFMLVFLVLKICPLEFQMAWFGW